MSINVNNNVISSTGFNSSGEILNTPLVVTDGLILWLDAGNNASYINSSNYYDCGYGCQYYSSDPGCINCNTQWKDMSGNGYDGTFYNGAVVQYDNVGGTVYFDGINDYVTVYGGVSNDTYAWTPNNTVGSTTFTMEIWIKTFDTVGRILSKPWNGGGQYNYGIYPNDWFVMDSTGTNAISFSNAITDNKWRQVVVWTNATQMGYYLDGGAYSGSQNHGLSGGVPSSGNNGLPLG